MENIQILSSPPAAVLRKACAAILLDEHYPTAWADSVPRIFTTWMQAFSSNQFIPFVWMVNGEVAGMQWAHDYGEDSEGAYTWLGGSAFRPFRGKQTAHVRRACWDQVHHELNARGYERIFGACLTTNRAAFHWIRDTYGWHPVGTYKEMLLSQGRLSDFHLFTVRPEDRRILWMSAERRSEDARHLYRQQSAIRQVA